MIEVVGAVVAMFLLSGAGLILSLYRPPWFTETAAAALLLLYLAALVWLILSAVSTGG